MVFGLQRKPDGGERAGRLRAVVEQRGSAFLVHAQGAVDAANLGVWHGLVAGAAAGTTAPGPLIVDAGGLEFMGVGAFAVLLEESARCRARGITLHLVSSQPVVARVVAATGLERDLAFSPTVDEALAAAPLPADIDHHG